MNKIQAIILLTLILMLSAPTVVADSRVPVWDVVELRDVAPGADADSIDVETRDGHIYITTARPVEVRVYTILGQLITKRKISPGTVRLTLGTRGVYILKTETATRRINL